MQFKSITPIIVLSLVIASLLVAGCTSDSSMPTAKATVTETATPTVKAKPSATVNPTVTVHPTATVKPTAKPLQCYHVDIIIYHNMSNPCNTCSFTGGMLQPKYANNPYWSIRMVNVNDQNGSGNLMVGLVRETGETATFGWGDINAIEAWSNAHLLCY
jgi:hypothetical protein